MRSLACESPVRRSWLERAKIGTVGDPRLGKALLSDWLARDGPGTCSDKIIRSEHLPTPDPLDAAPFFFGSYDNFLRWEEGRRQGLEGTGCLV